MKKFSIVLIMAVIFITAGCSEKQQNVVCVDYTISKIGGCNANGYCGVEYSGGGHGQEHFPTVGQTGTHCYPALKYK